MKNIYKLFLALILIGGTVVSCADGDNAIDQLFNDVDTSGAVLRTLVKPLDLVTLTGDNNSIDITIEVQEGDGQSAPDFKEVRVYVGLFADSDLLEPILDENGNEISEQQITTITASEFGVSQINGLPEYEINLGTPFIVDSFPGAQYVIPTFIATRLELELNDGRVFTNTNVTATVATGAYFSSPFIYKTIFINN